MMRAGPLGTQHTRGPKTLPNTSTPLYDDRAPALVPPQAHTSLRARLSQSSTVSHPQALTSLRARPSQSSTMPHSRHLRPSTWAPLSPALCPTQRHLRPSAHPSQSSTVPHPKHLCASARAPLSPTLCPTPRHSRPSVRAPLSPAPCPAGQSSGPALYFACRPSRDWFRRLDLGAGSFCGRDESWDCGCHIGGRRRARPPLSCQASTASQSPCAAGRGGGRRHKSQVRGYKRAAGCASSRIGDNKARCACQSCCQCQPAAYAQAKAGRNSRARCFYSSSESWQRSAHTPAGCSQACDEGMTCTSSSGPNARASHPRTYCPCWQDSCGCSCRCCKSCRCAASLGHMRWREVGRSCGERLASLSIRMMFFLLSYYSCSCLPTFTTLARDAMLLQILHAIIIVSTSCACVLAMCSLGALLARCH